MFFWQNTMEPSTTHPATRCIILLHDRQNKMDERDDVNNLRLPINQCRWLLCQRALADWAKPQSFHTSLKDVTCDQHSSLFKAGVGDEKKKSFSTLVAGCIQRHRWNRQQNFSRRKFFFFFFSPPQIRQADLKMASFNFFVSRSIVIEPLELGPFKVWWI